VLPYAAYLRVYEPAEVLAGGVAPVASGGSVPDPCELTRAEQLRSLHAAVRAPALAAPGPAHGEAAFELEREGRVFVAPTDEQLRGWLSLARLVGTLPPAAVRALTSIAVVDGADAALRSWRRDHPDSAEHVREATWRLPMPWLLVPAPAERENYDLGERTSLRYLTPMVQARRRVARAHAAARRHFPDSEELLEVTDLGRWLETFHAHGWVELDLAGLGPVLHEVDRAEPDRSLVELASAVRALRAGRVDESVSRYQRVAGWWGGLALREHAN